MPCKLRILVAEDDLGIRDLLRNQLETAGYEVHIARNGNEALQRIVSIRPHGMVLGDPPVSPALSG